MAQTTQQHAAMVNEARAVSQALAQQADQLSHPVAQFQLDEQSVARP